MRRCASFRCSLLVLHFRKVCSSPLSLCCRTTFGFLGLCGYVCRYCAPSMYLEPCERTPINCPTVSACATKPKPMRSLSRLFWACAWHKRGKDIDTSLLLLCPRHSTDMVYLQWLVSNRRVSRNVSQMSDMEEQDLLQLVNNLSPLHLGDMAYDSDSMSQSLLADLPIQAFMSPSSLLLAPWHSVAQSNMESNLQAALLQIVVRSEPLKLLLQLGVEQQLFKSLRWVTQERMLDVSSTVCTTRIHTSTC